MKIRVAVAASAIALSVIAAPQASAATNICIAYDTGGPGDRGYNDATLAGVKKAQNQYTFTFEGVVTDGTAADRTKRLRALTAKNCATIIAVGGEYANAISPLALEFPNIQFAIIGDASIPALNVTSIEFADEQGAFLAGYSAALSTKSGKVAMITTPSNADSYENGFLLGVSAAKKNVRSFVKYTATESEISAKLFFLGRKIIEIESKYLPRMFGQSKGASWAILKKAIFDTLLLVRVIGKFRRQQKNNRYNSN